MPQFSGIESGEYNKTLSSFLGIHSTWAPHIHPLAPLITPCHSRPRASLSLGEYRIGAFKVSTSGPFVQTGPKGAAVAGGAVRQ